MCRDLARSGRPSSPAPGGGLQLVRRRHTFFVECESLVFFKQAFALVAKVFVFITVLDGCEVLLGSEDKTTCQDQAAEQQQRQSGERCHVASAANFRI